jgi:hypothetical protein
MTFNTGGRVPPGRTYGGWFDKRQGLRPMPRRTIGVANLHLGDGLPFQVHGDDAYRVWFGAAQARRRTIFFAPKATVSSGPF